MRIAIGCDHIVTDVKMAVSEFLKSKGYEVLDFGTYDHVRTHYPIYGKKVGEAVVSGQADLGVCICGTGVGMSIAANKVKGIRASLCGDTFSAKFTRLHNDANILAMGGRVIGAGLALMMVDTFLETEFEGGRHAIRVEMMEKIESK